MLLRVSLIREAALAMAGELTGRKGFDRVLEKIVKN